MLRTHFFYGFLNNLICHNHFMIFILFIGFSIKSSILRDIRCLKADIAHDILQNNEMQYHNVEQLLTRHDLSF